VCCSHLLTTVFLPSFHSHSQKIVQDCFFQILTDTCPFQDQFSKFFPFILFFTSTVLSPVSFIIYQLLISTPLYFSSPLTKNLSTFLGSLFSLLQNTFFSYYYELSFSICITSSVKMEVNIITSSFHVSQYVQLIKCH